MKKLRWLTVLMGVTLVIIIGFQAYWLKDNYNREKRSMQIKTGVIFQDAIRQLQMAKLKLPYGMGPSFKSKPRIYLDEQDQEINADIKKQSKGIITTKTLHSRISNSTEKDSILNSIFFISVPRDSTSNAKKNMPVKYGKFDSAIEKILVEEMLGKDTDVNAKPRRQIISMVNGLRHKLTDTSIINKKSNSRFFITKDSGSIAKRTMHVKYSNYGDSNVLKVLFAVDSLQDSIQLPEIVKLYSSLLKKEHLIIPFIVTKSTDFSADDEQDITEATVGLTHPVTYHLLLQNTEYYLIKKISLPVLFSLFLIGVTLLSFVVVYRNLLRQQKLAEIKNEFISNITHELKTPIATVTVAIEALKNFNAIHDPQKTKEYLDISTNELQRLGLLVDKVLKLSMFEKKEVELNKEYFDMKLLTQEVLDTMKLQFEKNNVEVNFNADGNDFIINADKLHITSVIYNLLDNALKYKKENAVINVALSAQQNNIELDVSDNGIGIAPEYQSKIFDKFFRVPTGNMHVVKGYGLGLSYVSHIVAQHNGIIHVQSDINKGSTFTIKIPKTIA